MYLLFIKGKVTSYLPMAMLLLSAFIFFGAMPNTSYSITIPSNIIYYLPISVMNQQSIAVAANTPIAIGVSPQGTSTSNIIGFNAFKYSQYYTCNLNNAEFFFANGTVADSWMEGNFINESVANTLCTSSSSQNALIDSANILYWVKIPGNEFLTANTGTPTYNTIYLGWTGNVLSSSNDLLSNTVTGEAPQLTCTPNANLSYGSCTSYGKYDNGGSVFNNYWNFNGTALPPTFTKALGNSASNVLVDNGLYMADNSYAGLAVNTPISNGNQLTGTDFETLGFLSCVSTSWCNDFQYIAGNGVVSTSQFVPSNGLRNNGGLPTTSFGEFFENTPYLISFTNTHGQNKQMITSVDWQANQAASESERVGLSIYSKSGFTTNTGISNSASQLGLSMPYTNTNGNQILNTTWMRTRIAPPSDILPNTTYGVVKSSVYIPPTVPTLTLSNTAITQGQGILFTASTSSLNGPFSYNYQVIAYNTQNAQNEIIANMLFTGNAYTSNSWFWQPFGSLYVGNSTFEANVAITDTHPTTVNSVYNQFSFSGGSFGYSLSVSPKVMDVGQSNTITIDALGGSGTYSVEWKYQSTNVPASNIPMVGASNPMELQFNPVSSNEIQLVFGGNSYNVISTSTVYGQWTINALIDDSLGNSVTSNTVPVFTLDPELLAKINPPMLIYTGKTSNVLYSVSLTGAGTPPYTYTYTLSNSLGTLIQNSYSNSIASNGFNLSMEDIGSLSYGFYHFNVSVKDSASVNSISNAVSNFVDHSTSCMGPPNQVPQEPGARNATFDVPFSSPGVTIKQITFFIGNVTAVVGYPTWAVYGTHSGKIYYSRNNGVLSYPGKAIMMSNPDGSDLQVVPYLVATADEGVISTSDGRYVLSSGGYTNQNEYSDFLSGYASSSMSATVYNLLSNSQSVSGIYGINVTKAGNCSVQRIVQLPYDNYGQFGQYGPGLVPGGPYSTIYRSGTILAIEQNYTPANDEKKYSGVATFRFTENGNFITPNIIVTPIQDQYGNWTSSWHDAEFSTIDVNTIFYDWDQPNQTHGFGNDVLQNFGTDQILVPSGTHEAFAPNGTSLTGGAAGDFLSQEAVLTYAYKNGTLIKPLYTCTPLYDSFYSIGNFNYGTNYSIPSICNPNSIPLGGIPVSTIKAATNPNLLVYVPYYNLSYPNNYGFSYPRWDNQSQDSILATGVEDPGIDAIFFTNESKPLLYITTEGTQGNTWGSSSSYDGDTRHIVYTSDLEGGDELYVANFTNLLNSRNTTCPQTGMLICGVYTINRNISVGQLSSLQLTNIGNAIAPYSATITLHNSNATPTNIDFSAGSFQIENAYPQSIYNESCNYYASQIFCVGGINQTGPTNAVYYANVSANGIGSWVRTTPYPIMVSNEKCIAFELSVLCVGGNTLSGPTNAVYSANIIPYGVGLGIDEWIPTNSYPTNVEDGSCLLEAPEGVAFFGVKAAILCVGGYTSNGETNAIYWSYITPKIGVNPVPLIGWNKLSYNYPTNIVGQSCFENFLYYNYCIGGYSNSAPTNSVYYEKVVNGDPNQINQPWTNGDTSTYPASVYGQSCILLFSQYTYCFGGHTLSGQTSSSYYADVYNDSGYPNYYTIVGPWIKTTSYPSAIYGESCVTMHNGYLACIGGNSGSGPANSVYFNDLPPTMSFTINANSRNSLTVSYGETSNTISTGASSIYGAWTFNVQISDSASNSTQVYNTPSISIRPALVANSVPQYSSFDSSLDDIITSHASGGTPPYTYNYTIYNSSYVQIQNALYAGIMSTSNSFLFDPNPGTYYVNTTVTDSSSSPQITFTNYTVNVTGSSTTTTSTSTTTVASTTSIGSTTSATTTVSSGSVGGGGGGSGGGGSGASGGGGSSKPIISNSSGQYTISNIAQLNGFSILFPTGISFDVIDNFITPTTTGITIGSSIYTLLLNKPILVGSSASTNYYAELKSISYIPILQTVTVVFYSVPNNRNLLVNNTYNTASQINVSANITLSILSGSLFPVHIMIINDTGAAANMSSLPKGILLEALNISASPKVAINLTFNYPCSIADVSPYELTSGSWATLPFIKSSCGIDFSVPADPIIGIFSASASLQGNSSGTGSNSGTTSANSKTTLQSTTIIQKSASTPKENAKGVELVVSMMSALIAVTLLIYYMEHHTEMFRHRPEGLKMESQHITESNSDLIESEKKGQNRDKDVETEIKQQDMIGSKSNDKDYHQHDAGQMPDHGSKTGPQIPES